MHRSLFALVTVALLVTGCSSGSGQLEGEILSTERRLADLEKALTSGSLRNANLVEQYATILAGRRSELAPLLAELKKEATVAGPLYQSLRRRFEAVKGETEYFESWADKVSELQLIQSAADPAAYNDALSDTVNVMADMSEGQLARVNAVSREAEITANGSKDMGPGSQYIGNPHYGSWSHGSGGSFWVWYGQYAFFSSLFDNRRYRYDDWARNRGYSYYSDYGRNAYSSRQQRATARQTETLARKNYRGGGSFQSPYAKTRTGSSGISRASIAQTKAGAFKSPYAKGSSSKFGSSMRSSGSRTSRGTARGK